MPLSAEMFKDDLAVLVAVMVLMGEGGLIVWQSSDGA